MWQKSTPVQYEFTSMNKELLWDKKQTLVQFIQRCIHAYRVKYQLDNSKLGSTQQQKIGWHWHVSRIISSLKTNGLYARKHHIVEMRGEITDAGQTTDEQVKIELLSQWKLEAESRNIVSFLSIYGHFKIACLYDTLQTWGYDSLPRH